MKLTRVSSSQIYALGHSSEEANADEPADTLEVEFSSGSTWSYRPVSTQRFRALRDAESIGKYFNREIKNADGVKAERVS